MLNIDRVINQERQYINEYVALGDGLIAHRFGICATDVVAYGVYRQVSGFLGRPYSSFHRTDEYGYMGDITTLAPPPEIDALPVGPARIAAVCAHYAAVEAQAEALAKQAFPADFA